MKFQVVISFEEVALSFVLEYLQDFTRLRENTLCLNIFVLAFVILDDLTKSHIFICCMIRRKSVQKVFCRFLLASSDTFCRGPPTTRSQKKSKRSRFCNSYHTLPTIQPRRKVQLSKVVTFLKRFGCPTHPHEENRVFYLKFRLPTAVYTAPKLEQSNTGAEG